MRLSALTPGLVILSMLALAGCATAPAPLLQAPAPIDTAVVTPAAAPAASAATAEPVATVAAVEAEPVTLPPTGEPAAPEAAASEPLAAESIEGDRSSLWDRVRRGFAITDLDGERVARWERYYADRPDYVRRMVERGGRYLFHVVEEVERRGMPHELALLPFIESAFNPEALSRASASGMWQFMPATGRDFDLRQNLFRDDRRAVRESTGAALDYLQRLHTRFGDWHLALAAYNWGQGNVSRAIERNRRARQPLDYESLRMPTETRDYVPKLQAVKNIVLDAARLGLVLPELENHPFFTGVPIHRDIDVGLAAELAGIPLDEFRALNPQLNKPVILAAGTPEVLLPWESADQFRTALATATGPLASWTAWVAPRTMSPAQVAQTVGLREAELREINRIPPRMQVRAGSTLLVPRPPEHAEDVTAHVADHAQLALSPEARGQRRVRVHIGPQGASVAWVAQRYGVSRAQVARWNGVGTGARFRPGQNVFVMQAVPTRQAQARPSANQPRATAARKAPARQAAARAPARAAAKKAPQRTVQKAPQKAPQKAAQKSAPRPAAKTAGSARASTRVER